MNKYSNKIIIFCFIHLGDFILSTSAVAILKKTYPKFEITVIAPKNFEDIIEDNSVIDKALYCPYPEYNFKSKIQYLLWFITNWIKLLTKKCNIAIVFDGSTLSTIFSKFILVKKTFDTDKTLAPIYAKHIIDLNNFINLINMLNLYRNNLYFFIVGVKNDFSYDQRLMSTVKNKNIKNLCGKISLLELMSFINKTDLLISVDTGTIHIDSITKTPIVLIQLSKASTSIPLSSKVRVVSKILLLQKLFF